MMSAIQLVILLLAASAFANANDIPSLDIELRNSTAVSRGTTICPR